MTSNGHANGDSNGVANKALTDSKIQDFLEKNQEFTKTWRMLAPMKQLRAMAFKSGGGLIICQ